MTRLQESTVERLALAHGRVAVSEGYADRTVSATIPDGAEFRVGEDGSAREVGVNFSVRWNGGHR